MIEQLRRLVVGLALAGATSCSNIPGPNPPTPPTPPPPEPQCVEGQACGCWHHPPEALGWLYACCQPGVPGGVVNVQDPAQCIAPQPPPSCPEACPTGQQCTDPAVGCVPKPVDPPPVDPPATTNCDGEPGAITGETTTVHGAQVNAALVELTGCPVGSDCNLGNTTQQQFLRAVIDKLRSKGVCAGQHDPMHTDEIAVSANRAGVREGYHVFAGDDSAGPLPPGGWRKVVWSPGAARPSYFGTASPPPVDPTPPPVDPTPPPSGGCTAPLPPKVWTAETIPPGFDPALVGHTRYVMTCKPHGNDIDCTVQNQRACDYCAAIGMGEIGGQLRCGCPMRNECKPVEQTPPQNFKCEERAACEKYITGGTVLESRNGATCEYAHGNPFMFKPNGGNCRLCGANGTTYNGERQGCGAWY